MPNSILTWVILCIFFHLGEELPKTVGIRIATIFPMQTVKGSYIFSDSYDLYYSGKLTMYRTTVHFDSSSNGITLLEENRDRYFVFSNDSSFGLTFNDRVERRDNLLPNRESVDSIKKQHNTVFTTFRKGHKPDSSYHHGGELINVFEFKKNAEYTEDLTFYYYYSKTFKDIAETFTKDFDTAQGLKLFKIVVSAHGGYYKEAKAPTGPRKYVYEMKSVSAKDLQTAEFYFEKYRSIITDNKP